MKRFVKAVLVLTTSVLTFIATTGVANACWCFFYQPEVPNALREE